MVYRQTDRSARVRAASRARILKAARRLFAQRGFQATPMRAIAAAARTSIGNLYFYFANKEALLETLLAEAREPLWTWVDETSAKVPVGPARLALVVYGNALGLATASRDLTHMLLRESGPPELTDRIARTYEARIREYLAQNLPALPADCRDYSASAWVGAGRSCLERWFAGDLKGDPMALAAFVARWDLRGLGVPEPEIDEALAQVEAVVRQAGLHQPKPGVSFERRSRRTT
jgi:AcrR family transcriptional regulator